MSSSYLGEKGKNMHYRSKEHLTNFNSKKKETREESSFYKHLTTSHGGVPANQTFAELFQIEILKAYKKTFTINAKEGTYIATHTEKLLISKSEWHQPSIIRTRTSVIQGGVEQFLANETRTSQELAQDPQ